MISRKGLVKNKHKTNICNLSQKVRRDIKPRSYRFYKLPRTRKVLEVENKDTTSFKPKQNANHI